LSTVDHFTVALAFYYNVLLYKVNMRTTYAKSMFP
jgi:hypothetical protein